MRANDSVVEFGTERVDDARVTVEATAGDEIVPEPTVSVTITVPTDDGDGGVSAAACLPAAAARRLAALAETCASEDETRDEPETLVDAAAAVGRLSSHRSDVTILDDSAAQAGILYSDSDGAPALVIDTDTSTSSTVPHVGAGATISVEDLRALAEALRHESAYVEEG